MYVRKRSRGCYRFISESEIIQDKNVLQLQSGFQSERNNSTRLFSLRLGFIVDVLVVDQADVLVTIFLKVLSVTVQKSDKYFAKLNLQLAH